MPDWTTARKIFSTGPSSDAADSPTLTPYHPEKPTGSAIIVLPGGGYQMLADHEGEPVARWLNTLGITAFVLRYRLSPHRHPTPLNDARRAIRLIRFEAKALGLDESKIGILGFSAGGHLAASASTHFDFGDENGADPIDRVSSRPDVSVLLYPVISFAEKVTHGGSKQNLLGTDPSPELIELMSAEKQVTAQTPPAFLFHTADDAAVPVANALLYSLALSEFKIPFELHIYETGHHGVGLAANHPILGTWPARCADWLKGRGF